MMILFHQNMQDFPTFNKIADFITAFESIQRQGHDFVAAGFTEVLRDDGNDDVRLLLVNLAGVLGSGELTKFVMIKVGRTALGSRVEFIGIAWNEALLTVEHAGQVVWNSLTSAWTAHDTTVIGDTIDLPRDAGADTRGLAYIAGRRAGANPLLLGFAHNVYTTGERSLLVQSLPVIADKARRAAGRGYENAEVILGGDFNVEPHGGVKRRGDNLSLAHRAARDAAGNLINTTNSHPYDFWAVSNLAITDARAAVHLAPRQLGVSDHAAITLIC